MSAPMPVEELLERWLPKGDYEPDGMVCDEMARRLRNVADWVNDRRVSGIGEALTYEDAQDEVRHILSGRVE